MVPPLLPLLLCLPAALVGLVAERLHLPLPYLLGGLLFSGTVSILANGLFGVHLLFPQKVRFFFIAVVGVLIGGRFSPDAFSSMLSVWTAILVMPFFVLLLQLGGYALFRVFGKLEPRTALFASMPGGLIEAVSLGERYGCNLALLSALHISRIVFSVVAVPLLFFFWGGLVVGSASGQTFADTGTRLMDLLLLAAIVIAGRLLGRRIGLPAAHLLGPLILSALFHGTGILQLAPPAWTMSLAQLVVGVALGCLFSEIPLRLLARSMLLSIVYVVSALTLAYAIATLVAFYGYPPTEVLFLGFAPGGITEMSLVALSLNLSPVIVASCHLARLICSIALVGISAKLLRL